MIGLRNKIKNFKWDLTSITIVLMFMSLIVLGGFS